MGKVAGVGDGEEAGVGVGGGVEFGAAGADYVGGAVDDEDGCFDGGELGDDVVIPEASSFPAVVLQDIEGRFGDLFGDLGFGWGVGDALEFVAEFCGDFG